MLLVHSLHSFDCIAVPVPPDWGNEMIEAASASPPNKKKEQAGSMELSNPIVLSAALHTRINNNKKKKEVGVSIICMLGLGLPPA